MITSINQSKFLIVYKTGCGHRAAITMTGKKALVVLTNEAFLPSTGKKHYRETTELGELSPVDEVDFNARHRPTGVDIMEVGHLWLKLAKENDYEMTFCSPCGGGIAFDPTSVKMLAEHDKELSKKIWTDCTLMAKLNHTYPIEWIRPDSYDLVIIPGSHAAMFDLPENKKIACCIAECYRRRKAICAIGHGVAALLNVRLEAAGGEYLLKGKRITCFTREEENKVNLEKLVPFSIEEKAKERGAKVELAKPFEPKVVTDERLITAQSTPSIHEFIQAILKNAA